MLLPLLTAMSETGLLERRLVPKLITIDHDDDLQGGTIMPYCQKLWRITGDHV